MNSKKYQEEKTRRYHYLRTKGFGSKIAQLYSTYSWKKIKSLKLEKVQEKERQESYNKSKKVYLKWLNDLKKKLNNGYTTSKKP